MWVCVPNKAGLYHSMCVLPGSCASRYVPIQGCIYVAISQLTLVFLGALLEVVFSISQMGAPFQNRLPGHGGWAHPPPHAGAWMLDLAWCQLVCRKFQVWTLCVPAERQALELLNGSLSGMWNLFSQSGTLFPFGSMAISRFLWLFISRGLTSLLQS